jgi:hypothetical protein
MQKKLLITILVAVLTGALGFFAGVQYQKTQKSSGPGQFQMNGSNKGNANSGSRPVSGEITAIDAQSITLKTSDGGSKIILISDSTQINKTTAGAVSDLKTGDTVMAIGTQSSNGTVTAQTISVGGSVVVPPTGQSGPDGGQPPGAPNQ